MRNVSEEPHEHNWVDLWYKAQNEWIPTMIAFCSECHAVTVDGVIYTPIGAEVN